MAITASRLDRIAPSPTMAVTGRARELKAAGVDVIGLGAGEPDFDTPEHMKTPPSRRWQTATPNTQTCPDLQLEAVCAKFERENGLSYTPDEIMACGGKQNIYNAMMASVQEGDEVVIPAPYWVSYPDIVLLAEGTPVIVQCSADNGFKMKPKN